MLYGELDTLLLLYHYVCSFNVDYVHCMQYQVTHSLNSLSLTTGTDDILLIAHKL